MIKQPLTMDEVVSGAADRYAALGFQTRPDLGQHFLRTPDAAHALLERAGIPAGADVLQVGAGLGTLSRAIAAAGHRIWAAEKDERLREHLTEQLAPFGARTRVTVDDVRRVDLVGQEPFLHTAAGEGVEGAAGEEVTGVSTAEGQRPT
ncbi:rRNA adenine N-6-methyltransferase family protein [Streptomyces sp. NPDC051907]|uniref:rRNA adenine N-6-methyltransferase family protein n=1 Tax=Streptomyces sp. NPDC051907 TaxID=3155284 RepID=UPI0034366878